MKNKIKYLFVLLILLNLPFNFNAAYAAGGSGGDDKTNLYKDGKKLVYRAKKLEKKNKIEKAQKLYLKAYKKFEKAYSKDKKNSDLFYNKAKSIEAQQSLKTIQSLQKSHFYLNNTYSLDFNAIDFIPPKKTTEGGTANYTYEIIQATTSTFKARAVSLFDADGDGVKSTWEINENGKPIEVLKD